jgi:glutamate synthase (NADPH/NADH) large chain
MTGGTVAILGPVGDNFGAGMTGGMAFVYDTEGRFEIMVNPDSVIFQRIETPYWESVLRDLIAEHVRETQSRYAERILLDWENAKGRFWQVVPKEMLDKLAHPVKRESAAAAEKRA